MTNSNETDIDWVSVRRSNKGCDKFTTYELPRKLSGLRLLKTPLSSGQIEILATNLLDREVFEAPTMKSLYNMRWGVEEAFKLFKKAINIEYFLENYLFNQARFSCKSIYAKYCINNENTIHRRT